MASHLAFVDRRMTQDQLLLDTGSQRVLSCVDSLHAVPQVGYYIRGWLYNDGDRPVQLSAIGQHRVEFEFGSRCIWHERPDVDQYCVSRGWRAERSRGFSALIELPPRGLRDRLQYSLTLGSGESVKTAVDVQEVAAPDLFNEVSRLAASLAAPAEDLHQRLSQVGPAIEGLWSCRNQGLGEMTVRQFGAPISDPHVSVVVPLGVDPWAHRFQIGVLSADSELRAAEIILVVSGPERDEVAVQTCLDWHRLFGLSFKLVSIDREVMPIAGPGLGALVAQGRFLLFLGSEVIPRNRGWLGELRRSLVSQPNVGAIGPLLVQGDETLFHGGGYPERLQPGLDVLVPIRRLAGLEPSLVPKEPFAVPFLSRDCFLIERSDFERCGGLGGDYFTSGYPVPDLCSRLARRALQSVIDPGVRLLSLRVQPRIVDDQIVRAGMTLYDGWLYGRRWGHGVENHPGSTVSAQ